MAIEIDVLIVFADRDNETASQNEIGWVSQFKNFLEPMVTQVLGEKPNILLKGEFDTMTSPRLDNVAVMVPVLSKDFIQSGRCAEYVESFYRSLDSTAKETNRIFKVSKSPVPLSEQPPVLQNLFGYEMYQLDPDSGEISGYKDYFSAEAERQYWMEMVNLCYDIYEALIILKNGSKSREVKNIYRRKTVYLAETCHDLSVQRDILFRELQRSGYTVLPDHKLPGNINDTEKVIRNDLSMASMSIHLIGCAYGDVPEGSDRSLQDIQNRLASEKSNTAREHGEDFSRLIWITPDLHLANERQKRFIETLRRDVEGQEGAEILQTMLEDFKNIIREELEDAGEKKTVEETGGRAIYLIHDKVDHKEVKPFIDVIKKSGFNVLMPTFEGELLELRQKHIENLRRLDAAIIYKGKVNDHWVRMKVLDLLKAPGFGRKKPILGKAIVTPSGAISDPGSFKSENLRVIEGDETQSLDSVRSFLEEFKI
ncbi:MAG TPA: hypothetical protein VIU13_12375 [Chryseolinea sp.]